MTVKCLVWDLDNTLWSGVLLEGDEVRLREEALATLHALDRRGILHSIASKNDTQAATAKLIELGVEEFFLYPQISWSSKVLALENIAKALNIGVDTLAFIDDQASEREEVKEALPSVRCYDAALAGVLPQEADFIPERVTEDSKNRRAMYRADAQRNRAEQEFVGPKESFLAGLGMVFTIARAEQSDLARCEELTVRTNQLNTTGYTYSYDELDRFRTSDRHDLYVASLVDRFGDYGKIGLALVEHQDEASTIKLLLMSCRVMNRGVGTILLGHILERAKIRGVRVRAEFIPNGRNRMMLVTYGFAGFKPLHGTDQRMILEHDLREVQPFPRYVTVHRPE